MSQSLYAESMGYQKNDKTTIFLATVYINRITVYIQYIVGELKVEIRFSYLMVFHSSVMLVIHLSDIGHQAISDAPAASMGFMP